MTARKEIPGLACHLLAQAPWLRATCLSLDCHPRRERSLRHWETLWGRPSGHSLYTHPCPAMPSLLGCWLATLARASLGCGARSGKGLVGKG